MPRGRKSKKQASEKRHQAGSAAHSQAVAQATAAVAAAASVEAAVALDAAAAAVNKGKARAKAAEAKAEVAVAAAIVAAAAAVAAAEVAEATSKKVEEEGANKVDAKPTAKGPSSRRGRGTRRRGRPEPASLPQLERLHEADDLSDTSTAHEGPKGPSPGQAAARVGLAKLPVHLTPDVLARKSGMLEQFLMYKFKMKQLILKNDMLALMGPEYQEHFAEILKKASERIEVAFGVHVKEVDPVTHTYDLVSKLKLPNKGRLRAGKGLPKTGLLINILGMIFMKGHRAKEEEIWKFLGMMKIYAGKKHSIFGEPRKLITRDLVKLEYLEYRQIPGSDPPSYEFLWGPKAHAESTKMQILEFLAKINGTTTATFLAQYEEAFKGDKEKSQVKADNKQEEQLLMQRNTCRPF